MSFCKLKRDAIISVEFYLFQRGRLGAITREKKKYSIIRVKAQTDAMWSTDAVWQNDRFGR